MFVIKTFLEKNILPIWDIEKIVRKWFEKKVFEKKYLKILEKEQTIRQYFTRKKV